MIRLSIESVHISKPSRLRPQQLSRSKYLMNSASSAAEMTLNRLNFASKLTPTTPFLLAFRPLAPLDNMLHQRKLENVQLWDCFNLETMFLKNFPTSTALSKPEPKFLVLYNIVLGLLPAFWSYNLFLRGAPPRESLTRSCLQTRMRFAFSVNNKSLVF